MSSLDNWYRLDNAAKIFPAVTTKRNSSTFRISVHFTQVIDPLLLQESLDIVLPRFPMFKVRIRRGFFWYFLETNDEQLVVKEEENAPCSSIDRVENNGYLLRVLYYQSKLSVECFHSVTDGAGALEFVKLLSYEYLTLSHGEIDPEGKILSVDDIPSPLETEDSFKTYFKPTKVRLNRERKAYKIKGTRFHNFGNNVVRLLLDSDDFKVVSKKYGVTMTEYIVALFIASIQREKIKTTVDNHPVNIVVPVNLRMFFPSSTLRNFFSIITVAVDSSEELPLENIVQDVASQFKSKLNRDRFSCDMSYNYKAEKLLYLKAVPLILKNLILRLVFANGTTLQTGAVSNLGRIVLPSGMNRFIDHMEVLLYSTRKNTINCGVCSVQNKLAISFTRTIQEPSIVRNFVNHLSLIEGLRVNLSSNQWGIHHETL